jgi:hypothetical protein
MANHFKIHELLNASELEELEAFAREPGRTYDEIHEWLQARGFTVSRTAAGNWKREFDQRVMAERFSRSSGLAAAINGAISKEGIEAVAKGASKQLMQVIFEQSSMLEQDGKVDPLDVQRWTRSLNNLVESERKVLKLQEERDEALRKQAELEARLKDGKANLNKELAGVIPQERIDAAGKRIFGF